MFLFGTTRDRRAVRQDSDKDTSGEVKFIHFLHDNPILYSFTQLALAFIEISACAYYFTVLELYPNAWLSSDEGLAREYMVVAACFAVYFVLHYIVVLVTSDDRVEAFFSLYTVAFVFTAIPTTASWIYYEITGISFWTPMFLRMWMARENIDAFAASSGWLRAATIEIIANANLFFGILLTCLGFFQVAESFGAGEFFPFTESLYFLVVTVTTLGFGSETYTRPGRSICMLNIFVTMFTLPTLLNNIGDMVSYIFSHNTYNKNRPHVIVCGAFSVSDVDQMLIEFTAGDRKFSQLDIVMVSLEPFDAEIIKLLKKPAYREKVTLCIGDLLKRGEMERFGARTAAAAFVFSSRNVLGNRGDIDAILRSIALMRHDASLPQYMMLKRGTYNLIANRSSGFVFERESLKYALMGLSVELPGIITFVINLIKTQDFAIRGECKSWWAEYEQGQGNSIFHMPVPEACEGRLFGVASLMLFQRTGVTPIGIVSKDNKDIILNPAGIKLSSRDLLIVIATGSRAVVDCLQTFDTRRPQHLSSSSPLFAYHCDYMQDSIGGESKQKALSNSFPFHDHVLLIDLCGMLEEPDLGMEEKFDAEKNQSRDLCALLRPNFSKRNQTYVLLSKKPVSRCFADDWPSFMKPIYHLYGSGIDDEGLDQCNIPQAKGIIIFTSLEGEAKNIDCVVCLVQRKVFNRLKIAGREHDVPIITEVDDTSTLSQCEPTIDESVEESVAMQFQSQFSRAPSFAVGGGISSGMMETIMYQTYYNEYLPRVIEELLTGTNAARQREPTAQGNPLRMDPIRHFLPGVSTDVTLTTYRVSDLFRSMSTRKMIPFGLRRVIRDEEMGKRLVGHRFFFTNPPPSVRLMSDDIVYYIKG